MPSFNQDLSAYTTTAGNYCLHLAFCLPKNGRVKGETMSYVDDFYDKHNDLIVHKASFTDVLKTILETVGRTL